MGTLEFPARRLPRFDTRRRFLRYPAVSASRRSSSVMPLDPTCSQPLDVAAQRCSSASFSGVDAALGPCSRVASPSVYTSRIPACLRTCRSYLLRVLGLCFEAVFRSRTRLSSVCSACRIHPHPHRPGVIDKTARYIFNHQGSETPWCNGLDREGDQGCDIGTRGSERAR